MAKTLKLSAITRPKITPPKTTKIGNKIQQRRLSLKLQKVKFFNVYFIVI
jgi:hypothetical protein